MKNGDQPAFPREHISNDGTRETTDRGLTKREYFAAMAMQGYISILSDSEFANAPKPVFLASECVRYADALLTELEK